MRALIVATVLVGCAQSRATTAPSAAVPVPVLTPPARAPPRASDVTGRVLHLHSGAPLADAVVVLSCDGVPTERTTDEAGRFVFVAAPLGDCSLQALSGRGTVTVWVDEEEAARRGIELRIDPAQKYRLDLDLRSEVN